MGKIKPSWILIGVLVIGALCLFSVFGGGLGNLFGGGGSAGETTVQDQSQARLGSLYSAVEVDNNGCPGEPASEFYPDETIYVGLRESTIPEGTELFMRLYHEGQPVEDTPPVEAERDMRSCVWFEFDPGQAGFEQGDYEAELVVNGNPVDTIGFEVSDTAAGQSGFPATGNGGADLGRGFASTGVDQAGCPIDNVSEFYPDETVYVGFDESYIPAGTEVFARLLYEGQAIEDTQPIVADQDLETCVWFEFQAGSFSGGLEPGEYTSEIYVDGDLAERVQFFVNE